ncbi:MAG: hypothetical protein IRZ00_16610 [Gemmatimonadetes bacterium]|nr:hypothetical protein [Gemmatimonadota bacterium]
MARGRLRKALRFINFRVLRNTPAEVWKALDEDDAVAIVANGETKGVLVGVEGGDPEDAIELVRRIRAQRALGRLRAEAQRRGVSELTEEEIEAEVRAARAKRRRD